MEGVFVVGLGVGRDEMGGRHGVRAILVSERYCQNFGNVLFMHYLLSIMYLTPFLCWSR